jgi:L-seryl-tRNA(Ser) seleniumtransferase
MNPDPAHAAADDLRRNLVPVYTVIEEPVVRALSEEFSRSVVLEVVKEVLDSVRRAMNPGDQPPSVESVVEEVRRVVHLRERDRLRPVVNATGVILHTGLGRAVLPRPVVEALSKMDRCCNMQVDLETGKRAKRNFKTEELLTRLTGAEAAMVVNNNAAATLLILAALCEDREVIVSQGQVLEIGGSFRLPDCIEMSGAKMVRVGTTNRTHLRDYEQALCENTGAILRVNPSNYRVLGFTKEVPIEELVGLKAKRDVLVIDDLGCGALVDTEQFGLPKEFTVQESVAAGADVVCFSGDKLIGSAQSGIIVGKRDVVARIKKHPFTRMMRVCKLTDLALEEALRMFLDPETLVENHPTLNMLARSVLELEERARTLVARLKAEGIPFQARVKEGESAVGGGSMPVTPLRTFVVALRSEKLSTDRLNQLLRLGDPPIMARVHEGDVVLDMRTLLEGDDDSIVESLKTFSPSDSGREETNR